MRVGLISRIALMVVGIEVAAYSALGWFYSDRFSAAAEEHIRSRLYLVGQMIAREELPVSALSRRDLIGDLVGAPTLDGMVIGGSGLVIVSTNIADLGRPAADIPGFDAGWIGASAPDEQVIAGKDTLTSVTQIRGPSGGPPIYDTVITIATTSLDAEKRSIAWRGRVVSVVFILLSSAAIILVAQRLITRRVHASLAVLKRVEDGALDASIPVSSEDELGQLQHGINSMTTKVGGLLTQHRRNEEEIGAILDAIADGVVAVGPDGAILRCNPSAAAVLGDGPCIRARRHIADLLPELQEQRWWCASAGPAAADRIHFERRGPDGTVRSIELGHGPIRDPDGTVVGAVLVLQDVTARRQAEQELRDAVERLTASNSELERFAYVASHDLQEPLRTIVSFTQLLERRVAGGLSAEDREIFTFVVDAAKRMSLLIYDLLTFSRVNTRGVPFAAVSLRDSCTAALDNLRETILESAAEIVVADLPDVVGDAIQLMQLFQNLIGNSIKFRRPEVRPRVVVSSERRDGEWVVSVADNGIGIAATDQDIFEIFRRLHTAGSFPGSGVGLAICRRIVERHHGRIWFDTRYGEGTTFHFTVPTPPAAASPA